MGVPRSYGLRLGYFQTSASRTRFLGYPYPYVRIWDVSSPLTTGDLPCYSWLAALGTGHAPRDELGEFFDQFVPYMPVRNVTADYPPTMLIHGTEDTDVPYEQSVMIAERLKAHGVEHELVTIPGGEHGLGGGDPQVIDAAYESALAFINQHLERPD